MLTELENDALRFERIREQLLEPAEIVHRAPLAVAIREGDDHPTHGAVRATLEADDDAFHPVALGHRFGPAFATAWFRLTGVVPETMAGSAVRLAFRCGTEATLWHAGRPHQGFDPYHDEAPLLPSSAASAERAGGGEPIDLLIEAACTLPLGATTFWWDDPELRARWREERPGRLDRAELIVVDDAARAFRRAWQFATTLVREGRDDDARTHRLNDALRTLLRAMPMGAGDDGAALRSWCADRLDDVRVALRGEPRGARTTCIATGHAHIDTAWLWPIRETRRKCARTFATQLRQLEASPRFHFAASQAQQYAFIEEDAPAQFEEIRAQVLAGRFEPIGGMWIEPDGHGPSGESFIRQVLLGTAWWRDRFGEVAPQEILYLPDTFGFPASLPQIARLCGLHTFITNKIAWSETNRFPHVTFRWRGIDGTDLLTHLTPGHNYNSELRPTDVRAGERVLLESDRGRTETWLQPYGWGDGGGGPDPEQVARAELMREIEGLPRVEHGSVRAFCDRLHEDARATTGAGRPLATWEADLYVEGHRGTFTTHARLKAANRRCERLLRTLEVLEAWRRLDPRLDDDDVPGTLADRRSRRTAWWRTVCLHQFHDILPGTSIPSVYEDTFADLDSVQGEVGAAIDALLDSIGAHVRPPADGREPLSLAFNPSSVPRTVGADDLPSLGVGFVAPLDAWPQVEPTTVDPAARTITNRHLAVTLDQAGRIVSCVRRADGREIVRADEPMATYRLLEDRPRQWEAWNVDEDADELGRDLEDAVAFERVGTDDAPAPSLAFERRLGTGSRMRITIELDPDRPLVRLHHEVEWQEERRLLRVAFPCDVHATHWTHGTPFGAQERPTHANTSWERARFEVAGHGWMDVSEPGLGVAILDDGSRIGRAHRDGAMSLSLLRAPLFPDPDADRGAHAFTLAIAVHDGDHRAAAIDRLAETMLEPIRVRPTPKSTPDATLDAGSSPFRIEALTGTPSIEIAAFKPSEDDAAVILRLVETSGARGRVRVRFATTAATAITSVDAIERPFDHRTASLAPDAFEDHGDDSCSFDVRPFRIVTLRVACPARGT